MNQRVQKYSGVLLLILALLTVANGVYFSVQNRHATRCQAEYNSQFIEQINTRAKISESDRESLVKLVKQVIGSQDRETSRKALAEYVETLERNDEYRKKHPLRELPKTATC
ncbi:hypothetical protein GCM10010423_65050 [Streptomyces levis]|uniref:Uncharacterized protein n=1 Tax=Streptomyces levis TaxID=285566 RepID=A0ABP6BBW6_9ACTN